MGLALLGRSARDLAVHLCDDNWAYLERHIDSDQSPVTRACILELLPRFDAGQAVGRLVCGRALRCERHVDEINRLIDWQAAARLSAMPSGSWLTIRTERTCAAGQRAMSSRPHQRTAPQHEEYCSFS